MNFPDFEELLQTYPASRIEEYQRAYSLKASLLGKIASQHLVEQEEINKKLFGESKKLNRDFNLSRAANVDFEKKVVELSNALKRCQDEKKVAEEALASSRKGLEKLQKTHDDDLKLVENLRKDCDKSSKTVEDLRVNNTDLAKTLSSKEQKIQDLEKALADRKESSEKEISDIRNKLGLLFMEYEKALRDFGVRPAPLPANTEISCFMKWIDTEFKALPGVISGASDFVAAFSVESILKLLRDFDCADLVKFHERLSQFPNASSTSRLHPNEDVLAIKAKFTREFCFASGKEVVKNIARANLDQVGLSGTLLNFINSRIFSFLFS
jgi:predicted  nucleic acid-binding Zn-ribbon protein